MLRLPTIPIYAFFFVVAASIGETTIDCPSGLASVTAEGEEHRTTVCDAARQASQLLAECGVLQRKPLRVSVVTELPEECPKHALSFYNTRTDTIIVPTLEKCVDLTKDADRFGIPMSRRLYSSILVHESTHAIVAQNVPLKNLNFTGQEYVAYVFQLLSMNPALRAQILRQFPHSPKITIRQLNE